MKKGYIRFLNGVFQGKEYGFTRSATFGRENGNSVQLMDPRVSRNHARIDVMKEGFLLKDLESTNGTFLNGKRIESCDLHSGDRILLGQTELLFSEREIAKLEEDYPGVKVAKKRKPLTSKDADFEKLALSGVGIRELKNRFQAILRVNRTIGNEFDIKRAFEKILDEIFVLLPADRGAILHINEETRRIKRDQNSP